MNFVLDASVTISWAFLDEANPVALSATRLLQTGAGAALVPALWWYEVRNILLVNEKRRRITPAGTAIFLNEIAALRILIAPVPSDSAVLDLSRQTGLTVYDASYLALAIQHRISIATLDRKLLLAASSLGVPALQ